MRSVAATLPYGLVPLCVPQLRTITLGRRGHRLGIEAASFRNGLPHESVRAMDVLTEPARSCGQIRRVPTATFLRICEPYGTLGYALLLEIELEPVTAQMTLRHSSFGDTTDMAAAITRIVSDRSWDGDRGTHLDAHCLPGQEMPDHRPLRG